MGKESLSNKRSKKQKRPQASADLEEEKEKACPHARAWGGEWQ